MSDQAAPPRKFPGLTFLKHFWEGFQWGMAFALASALYQWLTGHPILEGLCR